MLRSTTQSPTLKSPSAKIRRVPVKAFSNWWTAARKSSNRRPMSAVASVVSVETSLIPKHPQQGFLRLLRRAKDRSTPFHIWRRRSCSRCGRNVTRSLREARQLSLDSPSAVQFPPVESCTLVESIGLKPLVVTFVTPTLCSNTSAPDDLAATLLNPITTRGGFLNSLSNLTAAHSVAAVPPGEVHRHSPICTN